MSELLNKEKEKCFENLEELKDTINAIDYMLSNEDMQGRHFTINDLFLNDKDLGNRCAKLLVQVVRCLYRVFIQMLLRGTNINYECLKYVLCKNDGTDLDLQVVEKDGAAHISFSEPIDPINCQSLVNFTDQFLELTGVATIPLLKDFGSYTKTSSSDNVDNILDVPERKRDHEDNDDTDSDDSLFSFGTTTVQECKDVDGSSLHDSGNNISFREEKNMKYGMINDKNTDRDDDYDFTCSDHENENATTSQAYNDVDESAPRGDSVVPGSTTSQECKDLDESTLHDSENNISYHKKKVKEAINVDQTVGDGSYDFTHIFYSEKESATTSQAYNDVDESALYDDSVVLSSENSESESASTTSQECKDLDESTLSNEESYTFESFKKITIQKYEKLHEYYQENRPSLKCKVVVVYTDTKGDFKVLNCSSNREANGAAYSLEDILKDPFPVVCIKNNDKSTAVSLKQMKESCSTKVGQKETPSMRGTLHNVRSEEQGGFPLSFKLDTGADSGSVGYNYQIIKNFILTVATINAEPEPAIFCKVESDTIARSGVQVFDIDEDPNWNAIGLSTLQNYGIFFNFKSGRVVIGKHDDVTVDDSEKEVRVTFKKA